MLTPEEIEQIRQVVREEIKAAEEAKADRLDKLEYNKIRAELENVRIFNGPPLGPVATIEEIKNRFSVDPQWAEDFPEEHPLGACGNPYCVNGALCKGEIHTPQW